MKGMPVCTVNALHDQQEHIYSKYWVVDISQRVETPHPNILTEHCLNMSLASSTNL